MFDCDYDCDDTAGNSGYISGKKIRLDLVFRLFFPSQGSEVNVSGFQLCHKQIHSAKTKAKHTQNPPVVMVSCDVSVV